MTIRAEPTAAAGTRSTRRANVCTASRSHGTCGGQVTFLQFVAIDTADVALTKEKGSAAVLERLARHDPLLVTDLGLPRT